ncbi:MAG: DUF2273 domain-containing protein [Eubacteriales bacterium]|nr:DUF2273 domain-containing protein [Eubacteriales bacterium]
MRSFWQSLSAQFKGQNPARIGAIIGLLLALSLVLFGFWKTIFIIALTAIGYFLGNRYFANPEEFRNLLDKILPPGKFR